MWTVLKEPFNPGDLAGQSSPEDLEGPSALECLEVSSHSIWAGRVFSSRYSGQRINSRRSKKDDPVQKSRN